MLYGVMNFPVIPVLDELESLAALDFDFLELAMDSPAAHYTTVGDQKSGLLAALKRHEMQLVCHLPTFVLLADLTDSIRHASLTEVLKSLETVAALGVKKAVCHPAFISGMGAYAIEAARRHAWASLTAIVSKAAELGVTLCLENMFPRSLFGVEVAEFREIFNRFPNLMLTLDTGHANIGSPRGKRILKFIDAFADRIGHIHVSDNFGKQDNHLPIGSGTIAFPKIVSALKKTGYDDTVTFEVFTPDREYLRLSRQKFDRLWRG
ncbi:MAG: sugar phosphate isomerase/epimerase [Desulfobacterales bacterium]